MNKTVKNPPVLFHKEEECCGCTACYAACPVHAIDMRADDEGFLYPMIKTDLCIGCLRCQAVCPMKKGDCRNQ